ncbi:MAG: NAD(+)/NADH kinase, partial [Oligoflexia bacterium]|nr:NAD(+)/NADH kinase [Oligoflexia bacterium]
LRAKVWPSDGGPAVAPTAINDVYVERTSGAMALLRLAVSGATVVDQLACDGVIVATALGSTAYSFSAGGVPSHPMAQALHVTPICAHAPRLSPFVLPRQTMVEIEVLRSEGRPVRAFTDGIEHGPVKRVRISPTAEQVHLAFLPQHDFTATLVRKILKA